MSDEMTAAERQRLHDADEIRRLWARNSEAWAEVDRLRAELADCRAAAEPDEDAPSVVDDQRKSREDVIGEREALRRAWRQEQTRRKSVAAELADCRAENEQLHSWAGLMSLLDEHWPADIFQADPADETADPGPRIVALLRWLAGCRAAGDRLADAARRYVAFGRSADAGLLLDRVTAWRSATAATTGPVFDPTIATGIRLEDSRDWTAGELGLCGDDGEQNGDER